MSRLARSIGLSLALVLAIASGGVLAAGPAPQGKSTHGKPQTIVKHLQASQAYKDFLKATRGHGLSQFYKPSSPDGQKCADTDTMSSMGRLANRAIDAKANGKSGARALTPDPGDEGDDDADGPAGGQAETSIAVDSTGNHIVVGINDTRGFSLNPTSVSGFAYSDDGGATFTDGGQLPVQGPITTISGTKYPQVFGDPEIKYLGGSTFVYFSIGVFAHQNLAATNVAIQTMCVHRSTDYGHTWTGPFEIPSATNPHGAFTSATASGQADDAADKEFAGKDPSSNRVMMSWSNFTPFAAGGVEISTTFSDDIATATPPTWSVRQIVAATGADGQSSIPRFNGSGVAFVAWRRFPFGFDGQEGVATSTDNGASWGAPVNTSAAFLTMDMPLGNDRTNHSPGLDVDTSNGNVYLVFADDDSTDGADTAFQRSTDNGATWSSIVTINSRPGSDRSQWFPWVVVDNSGGAHQGRVYAYYYDQGVGTSGDITESTYVFSDDAGSTWSKPMPLTSRPFHAGWGNDTGQPNIGDYVQAVIDPSNGDFLAAYAGTKPVGFTDGEPTSTSFTTPDVFFNRVPASSSKISLNLGNVTYTESGSDGNIDVGDDVHLTLPLYNYVTNAAAASITGVSATLTSLTSAVTVTGATSAYNDIAAGATESNSTTFDLHVGSLFVPNTHIELQLDVTANEGTTTLLLTLASGTPTVTALLSEDFSSAAVPALPAGWTTAVVSPSPSSNIINWKTTATALGDASQQVAISNALYHANANDGPVVSGVQRNRRFERVFSPLFTVPANADYVTLDMDVAYDSEDEPAYNLLAYDGFTLRILDNSAALPRSALLEAFEEVLTTGDDYHFPKHLPRSSAANYFQDMSVWAGDSRAHSGADANGFRHVHAKLPGMAGEQVQLRFEFTQDNTGICTDVRPTHTRCGVLVDNIVVNSVRTLQATSVTIDPAAGQYSDIVTLKATVTPAVPGSVQFVVNGSNVGSPVPIDTDTGIATYDYTIVLAANSYTIGATFTPTDSHFTGSSDTDTLTVTKEDATVTPDSGNPCSVKVDTAGGTAHFTLSGSIVELQNGPGQVSGTTDALGDICKATTPNPITITLTPVGPGSVISLNATVDSCDGTTLKFHADFTSVPVNVYDIVYLINSNYYVGSAEAVIAVYDPSLGFTTGGGTVINPDTKNRANFGFNLKYQRKGGAQGSFIYVEHLPDGSVYIVKSNAPKSLSILKNGNGWEAIMLSKNAVVNGVGGYSFRVVAIDNGEPGLNDLFGLTVYDSNSVPVTNYNYSGNAQNLKSGNIQVPHGASK
jgi:hypothetical protein